MCKSILIRTSLSLILLLLIAACDEYNITEPRYFSCRDVYETVPVCPPPEPDTVGKAIEPQKLELLPSSFGVSICWINEVATILKIELALPVATDYQISIVGADEIIDFEGFSEAGWVRKSWDASDQGKGTLGVVAKAGPFLADIWFEIN